MHWSKNFKLIWSTYAQVNNLNLATRNELFLVAKLFACG
jgi:hypothetical protein